jgi:hypothetical protein
MIASPSIGRDAVSASPSFPPAASPSSSPSGAPRLLFRKYIILADDTGAEHPIIFSQAIQHSHLVRYDMRAVSAGFIAVHAGTVIVPEIPSTSLNLEPRPQDRDLLRSWLGLSTPSM